MLLKYFIGGNNEPLKCDHFYYCVSIKSFKESHFLWAPIPALRRTAASMSGWQVLMATKHESIACRPFLKVLVIIRVESGLCDTRP